MVVYCWGLFNGRNDEVVRAMAFAVMILGNLVLILINLSRTRGLVELLRTGTKAMWGIILGTLIMLISVLNVSALRGVFHFGELGLLETTMVLLITVLGYMWFRKIRQPMMAEASETTKTAPAARSRAILVAE